MCLDVVVHEVGRCERRLARPIENSNLGGSKNIALSVSINDSVASAK